ncbi:MAG: peptidase, partial [Angustibacter sp.]
RARQRLQASYDPDADPACDYPGEVPSLLKKTAALAEQHGAPVSALADTLKLNPAQVRDLLGEGDQRPALRLVGEV